jgi:hypothetical protein
MAAGLHLAHHTRAQQPVGFADQRSNVVEQWMQAGLSRRFSR